MRIKPTISISTAFLVLIVGFQNCSPDSSRVSFSGNSSSSASMDSGNPYEGKIYATVGNLCSDGSEIHSRIVMASASQAKLDRENCQNVSPVLLTSADFQLTADATTMIYKNQNFQYIGRGPLGITNLSFSNDATDFYYGYTYEGQPSWLQIFLDTDNNPATGLAYNGIGADFMIENDNLWQYAAPPGDQTTFKWTSIASANKNNILPNISWRFPKAAIGTPTVIKLIGHTSFGAETAVVTQVPQ